ncbi:cryptochrome/photolyase family protein [Hahella sp. CR1]|uniref:cryptochrome/photolyase family protein n=1 Tax=Hahella sp. CR1 TaxID=2992807 RepID=UPI00244184F1|nr:cryptochrome/photolyase family protein [Hahella sp. CR1]MDG9666701.1 cryptochrome/photolyase family protein [Hahella sp. CR1]
MPAHVHTLRLLLGDQLNAAHSWFRETDPGVLYVIAELPQEVDYVVHHVQKVCAFFASMQAFADALRKAGHEVLHLTLDDTQEFADLPALLKHLCERHQVRRFEYQRPDEYRLLQQMERLQLGERIEIAPADTEHFLLPFAEISDHFVRGEHLTMENFYRRMRKRFDILMQNGAPLGGKWNFDSENRNKIKAEQLADIPDPLCFDNDVSAILERLRRHGAKTFGVAHERLLWPVTRRQAQQLLQHFCERCLPQFGRYQDAMTDAVEAQWSLYHSRLSFALNTKMLHPMQVIRAALERYEQANGDISLPQIEGFVRQILGWREYVRGVYWANMPEYMQSNALDAGRRLPGYFWDGDTHMRCVSKVVGQSLQYAYAHHIQRLMVTGNFCLLTGIDPDQVDEWYLGVYVDAIEWVEAPNTRGMSQFADGGLIATKPYVSGGAYIHRMSDYCKGCRYDVKAKTGANACPFNSFYWRFIERHRERLQHNPRLAMIYRTWERFSQEQRREILAQAEDYLERIESL